jgi:hypothetical protein
MVSASAVRRRGALIAMVLVALVSTGCSTVVQGRASAAEPRVLPTAAPARPTPTAPAGPTGSTPPGGGLPVVIDPVIPGWNVVRSVNRAAAYDVPPDWNVLTETTIFGFGDINNGGVASTGASTFGDEACGPSTVLAAGVVRHDEGADLAASATTLADAWADQAYLDANDAHPTLTTSDPEPLTMLTGQPAVMVKTTAVAASPSQNSCATTTGAAYAVAATGFEGELGPTVILVVVTDVDSPGSPSEETIREILCTLRPVEV